MGNTPDQPRCIDTYSGRPEEMQPLSPFSALSYHFGMLLGVDDFETEQAYHRAKHRLHNAWLHREGVVWGFDVSLNLQQNEIHVTRGLALDAAGHELHLEEEACLNVGKWFEKHETDANFHIETTDDGRKIFHTHVVVLFKACLTRQVPALLEPCNNAGTGTAYSRVFETVEILLLPGLAPTKSPPYHRLRLLFGLEAAHIEEGGGVAAGDQKVLDALATIQALPAEQRPAALLAAFHRFAALDEIDLAPARSEDEARTLLFPERDNAAVVLANVAQITLTKVNDSWQINTGEVDTAVRPTHVATTTIQDLLCGPLFNAREPEALADMGDVSETRAGPDTGPRVLPASVIVLTEKAIMFDVDRDLHHASVMPAAFSVSWFDRVRGWQKANVETASYGGGETQTVALDLASAVSGRVRLIVFGTGPTPLLGADLVPLAGSIGGPPGTPHDGNDFVYMRDFVPVVADVSNEDRPLLDPRELAREEVIENANTSRGESDVVRPKTRRGRSAK